MSSNVWVRSETSSLTILLAGARQQIPHYESRAAALSLNNDITVFKFMLHCFDASLRRVAASANGAAKLRRIDQDMPRTLFGRGAQLRT
jgi:hypothetical protein